MGVSRLGILESKTLFFFFAGDDDLEVASLSLRNTEPVGFLRAKGPGRGSGLDASASHLIGHPMPTHHGNPSY